jgi:hypothetical protein
MKQPGYLLKLQVCPYVECPILLICLQPTISDFDVSDGFIIVVDQPDEPNCQTSYLVEPRRTSTAVTKFSGTFGATKKADKISATISAFSHFVMGHTACTLTFADIQGHYNILAHLFLVAKGGRSGSYHHLPGGAQKLMLFDPMTHSLYG